MSENVGGISKSLGVHANFAYSERSSKVPINEKYFLNAESFSNNSISKSMVQLILKHEF